MKDDAATSKQPPACVVRQRKTAFIDILRTTPPKTVCPNFYILAHANGCAFSPRCSYCYLKGSLWHMDGDHVFSNVDQMVDEVSGWIAKDELESYVLNSGNLSDSLAFEGVRALMARLIELFRTEAEAKGRPHALLLVTKGGMKACRPLFDVAPCRNVLVSFSVNSRAAARDHEQGAAAVEDRLEAARQLKAAGWRVRMRIDPMILGYDYAWIIQEVRRLAPERVTLGTLRAEPALIRLDTEGLFDKLERPADPKGVARYPKADRIAVYRQGVDALKSVCPVALCEETQDMWLALGLDVDGKPCNCGA